MPYHLPVLPPELAGPAEGWAPRESFSPSQLSTFGSKDGCKRKWAWGSCFGVWGLKKSIGTLLGSLIHGSLEHYMHGRTVYDLVDSNGKIQIDDRTWREFQTQLDRGFLTWEKLTELVKQAPQRALAGLNYIPNTKDPALEAVEIEEWIDIDTTRIIGGIERLKISGKIDLSVRRAGVWYLFDHKSTKGKPRDPWVYCKTPADLLTDPQSVFYALDVMLRHNLSSLWCRWVYYLTDVKAHPLAKAVDVELQREDVMRAAYTWLLVANEMRGYVRAARAGALDPNDVPANTDACQGFGGCAYHMSKGGPCMPDGEVKLGELILAGAKPEKETNMSLATKLAETTAILTGVQPPLIPQSPLLPPEAHQAPLVAAAHVPAAPVPSTQLPPGWEMGPAGPRQSPPPGYQYNAAGTAFEVIPPPVVAPPAPPEQPQPEGQAAGKRGRGRPPGARNKKAGEATDDVMEKILMAALDADDAHPLRMLTISQLAAVRDVIEA